MAPVSKKNLDRKIAARLPRRCPRQVERRIIADYSNFTKSSAFTATGQLATRAALVNKSLIVVRRYAAHVRLRDTVYHWARLATQRDPKCRARYTALRKRGHSHGRALRGVADRLLALACVLLQRQTLFDLYFGRPTA